MKEKVKKIESVNCKRRKKLIRKNIKKTNLSMLYNVECTNPSHCGSNGVCS